MPDSPLSRSRRRSAAWLVGVTFSGLAIGAGLARADPPAGPPPGAPAPLPPELRSVMPPPPPPDTPPDAQPDNRPLALSPWVALQETYTDNARLTTIDPRDDFITRGALGLDGRIDSTRTQARIGAEVAYDAYARDGALSGTTLDVHGGGSYMLVKDLLSLEASGSVADGYGDTLLASATQRAGTPDRLRVATYAAGPRLTASLGGVLDVDAAARFAQIFYSAIGHFPAAQLPDDDNIVQVVATADTGQRHAKFELLTIGELEGDVHGFRSETGMESGFLRIAPGLRLLGRGGYEHVEQPGVVRIDAPIWTGGVELTPGARSKITLEGGRRYGRNTLAASAEMHVGERYALSADYSEMIQPDQMYVASIVSDFTNLTSELPPPNAPGKARFALNVYNQVSLNKSARLVASYQGATQSVDVSARWADREFLQTHDHDRTVSGDLAYLKRFGRALTGRLDLTYTHTLASPLFGASRTWGVGGLLTYKLNRTAELSGGFKASDARQLFDAVRIRERAVMVAIKKLF